MTDIRKTPVGQDSVNVQGPGFDVIHYGPKDIAAQMRWIIERGKQLDAAAVTPEIG